MKKLVIGLLLAAFACTATAQKNAQSAAKRAVQFTVLQWNIWQEGTLIPGGFEAIVGEIQNLQPDFVTLSEVRNYNDVDFTHRLCQALKEKGLTYYSFRSKDSGLLSKHPIIDWRPIFPENRDHGSIYKLVAKVQGVEVAVYAGHLDYLDCAYYNVRGYDGNTFKETTKPESIDEVLRLNDLSWRDNAVQIFLNEAGHDIAAGRCVVFGGDFNEPSHLDWIHATANLYDHNGMAIPWTVSTMLQRAGFKDSYRVLYPNPVTHPGFTYPCFNIAAEMSKLTWAPKADERERIDLIYYKGRGMEVDKAQIFGPNVCVCRSQPAQDKWDDPILLPKGGTWPTDHRGLLVKFIVK